MESYIYEMDADVYQDTIHIDLKRDMSSHSRETDEEASNLPLFEIYQFLSPGSYSFTKPADRHCLTY